ncbi:MAG: LysR family transcriptional regulator [Myxococcota bacterium]|nr:LysR family transcriptional regulator [Myxococcota bacterium]
MNLFSIDLNLLLVLHTVIHERSVTRAARRMNLTQPAVSNALARLRVVLGDRLLVRAGRSLEPTPRVAEMLPRLAAALGELAVVVEARFDPATTTRTFTLADSEELSVLPRFAAAFARGFPQARLRLVTVDDVPGALASGVADAALGPVARTGGGLVRRVLYADRMVRVVRRRHPHARSPSRLAKTPQIVVQSELGRPLPASGARVAMVMPDYMSAALAVSECDLITTLPQRFATSISKLLPLTLIGPTTASSPIALYWHERTHGDPGAAQFRDLLVAAVR